MYKIFMHEGEYCTGGCRVNNNNDNMGGRGNFGLQAIEPKTQNTEKKSDTKTANSNHQKKRKRLFFTYKKEKNEIKYQKR